jgi:hypothetical protein
MRINMAPALAAMDANALALALDKSAAFTPDPAWQWSQIAKTAADAARAGDIPNARKSCQGCHGQYKAQYKEKYRLRAIK